MEELGVQRGWGPPQPEGASQKLGPRGKSRCGRLLSNWRGWGLLPDMTLSKYRRKLGFRCTAGGSVLAVSYRLRPSVARSVFLYGPGIKSGL